MFARSNYRILNQSVDLILEDVEDEKLEELTNKYRKIIFENKIFLLRESREKIIGVHAEGNGVGTSLIQKEETWVLNFGFSKMSLIEIGDMLSIFEPIEKMLKDLTKEVGISLHYLQENNFRPKKDRNSFLKRIVLTPPDALVEDEAHRLFQIRNYEESTLYTFKSLNGKLSSLNECTALLQNEEINAEEVFMPSLSHWLNSIKSPALVPEPSQEETNCTKSIQKKKLIN